MVCEPPYLMNHRPMTPRSCFTWLAVVFVTAGIFNTTLHAQSAAEVAAQQALELVNQGKTAEAIPAYEKILHDYPTSTVVTEAQFRLGFLYFQNGDFDKSTDLLKKLLQPPAPPEIQELAYSLMPQVLAAKASKLPPDDAQRKTGFEDAIKQFDVFIQKFPNSDEMEGAVYGRALCAYQIAKYDEAAAGLRSNLAKFGGKSETYLDSQYLLSITLATQAAKTLEASPGNAQAFASYDEAEKLLRDIVQKRTDIALANDAQFQLGEVLLNRAAFADKAAQPALYAKAVEAYRAVEPKELMKKAQEDRIAGILQRIHNPDVVRDRPLFKRTQELLAHERSKLASLESKADLTVTAKIKIAQAFYVQQRYDEARVMLHDLQRFAEDDTQKKTILYYVTLTYAAQNNVEKAVAGYNDFKGNYKNDPMADNLPLVIGGLFLNSDPDKAIQYFKEEVTAYPKGRFTAEALTQQAAALVRLKRFDEALGAFKSILATNPKKEVAASAELGIATIYGSTGKLDNAIAAYKAVREKYAGTPQAEQAWFYIGQTATLKGDGKTGVAELTAFLAKFPESSMTAPAMFYLASAEQASGNLEGALAKFKEVADKFPQNEVAPYSYFQRANILAGQQKSADMVAVMRDFIAKYPENDKIYFAYDSIAQNQVNSSQLQDAVATYEEFVTKHSQLPQAPAAQLKISDLWHRFAETTGRYVLLTEQQRPDWMKGVNESVAAAEKLVEQYPESPQVALALQTLLDDQRLLLAAKLKTDAEVQQYFQDLAKKLDDKPVAKSKVLFTLASYTYEKDKAKALEQMNAAYDPKLVYAPEDLDLYGTALLDQNKIDEARKVYEKLAVDYPNPPGVAPEKAPADIVQAQSIVLYGLGKCLQKEGNIAEAGKKFDTLKKLYPWSPKILEASFGIAQSLVQQKKYDDAITLLIPIMRAQSASATAELHANAMLLGGQIQEAKGNIPAAIDYYIKIAGYYEGVPVAASEGLWRGAQLLEKQAGGATETSKPPKASLIAAASKAYKNLVDKYPTSPHVNEAKQRLAALQPGK